MTPTAVKIFIYLIQMLYSPAFCTPIELQGKEKKS